MPLLSPGQQIARYTILGKLATGGMSELYIARQTGPSGFAKTLVLKVILPNLADDQQFIDMFHNEAKLAAMLNHPNVVQIFDFGMDDEIHYMAMEYIEGRNLGVIARVAEEQRKAIPVPIALRMVADACGALEYAHSLRDTDGHPLEIIHRDVSLENVLVTYAGQVKLVDFGIAKARNVNSNTSTGTLKGKYNYMSPEMIEGKPVDRRADLFAMGVVLYRLLCGCLPFDGDNYGQLIHRIAYDDPTLPRQLVPSLPEVLERVVMRALTKERSLRYQHAGEIQSDLEAYMVQTGSTVLPYHLAQYMADLFPPGPERDPEVARLLSGGVSTPRNPSVQRETRTGPTTPSARGVRALGSGEVRHVPSTRTGPATPTASSRGIYPPRLEESEERYLEESGDRSVDESGDRSIDESADRSVDDFYEPFDPLRDSQDLPVSGDLGRITHERALADTQLQTSSPGRYSAPSARAYDTGRETIDLAGAEVQYPMSRGSSHPGQAARSVPASYAGAQASASQVRRQAQPFAAPRRSRLWSVLLFGIAAVVLVFAAALTYRVLLKPADGGATGVALQVGGADLGPGPGVVAVRRDSGVLPPDVGSGPADVGVVADLRASDPVTEPGDDSLDDPGPSAGSTKRPHAGARRGLLSVSAPGPGTVLVDGREVGELPLRRLSLGKGGHRLEVRSPTLGYTIRRRVHVSGGGHAKVELKPQRGRLMIRVQPWATVSLDGRSLGTTPIEPVSVMEGPHTLVLRNSELGVTRKKIVWVKPGAVTEAKYRLP
ncbi:MAG: serine/threonine protein kinase [Deltaproteobacteria bacterium]|nr:serine/threonine protein kinase [Deltaproteobacteria bacterium]